MPTPPPLRLLLCFVATVGGATFGVHGQSLAGKVAGAKDNDEKEFLVNQTRKNLPPATELLGFARSEKHAPAVSLAFGLSLEKGTYQDKATAAALKMYAARPGMLGKAATMAALSPLMASLLNELSGSSDKFDQRLAAAIAATHAFLNDRENEYVAYRKANAAAKAPKEKPAGDGTIPPEIQKLLAKPHKERTNEEKKIIRQFKKDNNIPTGVAATKTKTPAVKSGLKGDATGAMAQLLKSKDALTLELAVLAAAYAQHAPSEPAIVALRTPSTSALSAARQFYLARIGKALDERAINAAFNQTVKRDKRHMNAGPGLHDYHIQSIPAIYALLAVGEAKDKRFMPRVHRNLKSHDLRVQQEAARAMGRIGDPDSVELLWKHFKTAPSWPVKIALFDALGANPAKDSVDRLMAMYREEKGRLRQDIAHAVLSITRGPIGPTWFGMKNWWAKNKDKFAVDRDATAAWRKQHWVRDVEVDSLFTFYGAKIISDRLVFVLDTSASMRGEKLASLKKNMDTTLQTIPDFARFNVVDFGGYIKVMQKSKMIPARHASAAIQQIGYMDTTGGTRSYDAMERALQLPELDTILYLSDGAPVGGQFQDWHRIAHAFWVANRYRPVAMPSILFKGNKNQKGGQNAKNNKMAGFSARQIGHLYLPEEDG